MSTLVMSRRASRSLLLIGIGLIVWGFFIDPSYLTSDGYQMKHFLYFMGGLFVLIPLIISRAAAAKQKRLEDLLATGQQGDAVILSLEDTGVRVNDNPRVSMMLEVRLDGHAPYQVEKTMLVPLIRMSQVQVGSTVEVVADPSKPDDSDKVELLLK